MPTLDSALASRGLSIKDNLNASTDPGPDNDSTEGYQIGSVWTNSLTGRAWRARSVSVAAAIWNLLASGNHPGYIANNWYNASEGYAGSLNAGTAGMNGQMIFYPVFIRERITITALGVRVGTANAGNVQAAIYANNPATNRPTGNALASTTSMSTASATNVNATVNVQLEPGMYWFATNIDNATATLIGYNGASSAMGNLVGSPTQSSVLANQVQLSSLTLAQTFGTWPDVTASTFVDTSTNKNPIVQFKVGSVP